MAGLRSCPARPGPRAPRAYSRSTLSARRRPPLPPPLECFHTGCATRESDVFGFGAVILEVVCGRRISCSNPAGCSQLLEWVWRLHGAGRVLEAVDPRLGGAYDEEEAERLLLLGLACSHPNPRKRPTAQAILQNLQTRSVPPLPVLQALFELCLAC